MTRISQILAVVGGVKADVNARMDVLGQAVSSPELTTGISKTYQPRAEPRPGQPAPLQRPAQHKPVQVTVAGVLEDVRQLLTRQLDVTRTLDEAKMSARGDVTVDGETLLTQVPTDHLIFLEGRLAELYSFALRLPVLDATESWSDSDTEEGQYRTPGTETTSEDTVLFNHELVKAQVIEGLLVEPRVEVRQRQEVVGYWTTVKYSGAVTARRKRQLLDRLAQLREAVKYAREEANTAVVEDYSEGRELFDWLLRP